LSGNGEADLAIGLAQEQYGATIGGEEEDGAQPRAPPSHLWMCQRKWERGMWVVDRIKLNAYTFGTIEM
jgi:hypothetical protein